MQSAAMALCSREGCGQITFPGSIGSSGDNPLSDALLGGMPAVRYLQPWVRLFFRTVALGYRWRPYAEPCWECGHELASELRLPPTGARLIEPTQVVVCLSCGAVALTFWERGETATLSLKGGSWTDPPVQLLALSRALHERVYAADDANPHSSD